MTADSTLKWRNPTLGYLNIEAYLRLDVFKNCIFSNSQRYQSMQSLK